MHGHISPVKAGFSLKSRKSKRNWLEEEHSSSLSTVFEKL